MGSWNLIVPLIVVAIAGYFLVRMFRKRNNPSKEVSRSVGEDVLTRRDASYKEDSSEASFVDKIEDSIFSFLESMWKRLVLVGKRYTRNVQKKQTLMKKESFQKEYSRHSPEKEQREEKKEQSRPMISETVVQPKRRSVGMKEDEKYEEMLVERIAYNPHDVEAYELLGDYYINQRNFEDAKECYKQILKLSPGSRSAKVRIRRLEHILAKDEISR
jgi:tetratricopeptide (TPR) repeat protein